MYDPSASGGLCGWQGYVARSRSPNTRCGITPPASTLRFCPCLGGDSASTPALKMGNDAVADSEAFDCAAGFAKWQTGWSAEKRTWCCKHKNRGCDFDCTAGFSKWATGWSADKKVWCCEHEQRGCSDGAGQSDGEFYGIGVDTPQRRLLLV